MPHPISVVCAIRPESLFLAVGHDGAGCQWEVVDWTGSRLCCCGIQSVWMLKHLDVSWLVHGKTPVYAIRFMLSSICYIRTSVCTVLLF